MHFRLFHNIFIADLSGKWKLSRVLTPFVTGPEDRKSIRIIGHSRSLALTASETFQNGATFGVTK